MNKTARKLHADQVLIYVVLIAVAATIITVIINTMAGYAFAKYRFKGDTFLFVFFIATLMLPAAKPAMSVLAIFSFLWRWNDYMWPLLVIRDTEKYTVQLALANFAGQYTVDWNSMLAMSVVTMIPVLILFLLFQKQFVKGMVTAGMKE